jgi:hypothetical protein
VLFSRSPLPKRLVTAVQKADMYDANIEKASN